MIYLLITEFGRKFSNEINRPIQLGIEHFSSVLDQRQDLRLKLILVETEGITY